MLFLISELKSFAVSRSTNPGLGAVPNHRGHGVPRSSPASRPCLDLSAVHHRFLWAFCGTMLYSCFRLRPRNFQETLSGNSTSLLLLHSPHAPFTPLPTSPRRALARSQILRATSANSPLPPVHYKAISQHLSQAFAAGEYLKDGPPKGDAQQSAPPNPLTDPAAMDGMMAGMKTQMVMMVPQMVIMGWINFFFQGFVLSEFSSLKLRP